MFELLEFSSFSLPKLSSTSSPNDLAASALSTSYVQMKEFPEIGDASRTKIFKRAY